MLSGPLAHLTPGALAYLALVIVGMLAFAITLASVKFWADRAPAAPEPASHEPDVEASFKHAA